MSSSTLLRIAGVLCLLFTIFHLAFPFIPQWDYSLNAMHPEMKYIFISLHYGIIVLLAGTGLISTFQPVGIITSQIKVSILMLFSSLFIIRIFTEFLCWGFTLSQSIIVLVMCIIPIVCFGMVALKKE